MYERNAIVIDRHFSSIFGYDKNNNIKNNSSNYFELVSRLEKYQEASETENNIMAQFERVANRIRETQKLQDVLNKRSLKYAENRKSLFEDLEEDAQTLAKKFGKIEDEVNKNNEEIKQNEEKFVEEIKEFNEKSEIRNNSGRERRIVENEYQKILDLTIDNFDSINKEKLKEIKEFIKSDDKNDEKEQIKQKILKNGAKEKVPFNINVITSAIDISTDIEGKKAEILLSLYDKTNKLLDEIKKDTVKIDKHKKIVKDAKSKLDFLNTIIEYIILFLDNERMNAMGGKKEHENIMNEACDNLQKDLVQIQNMYSLLIKEMAGKASKKAYEELYNIEYLYELQENERRFSESISKLNMRGTVVYPDYWRVEGMQKIYDIFKHLITDIYEKDLTIYEPLNINFAVNEEALITNDDMQEEDDDDNEIIAKQEKLSVEIEDNNKNIEDFNNEENINKEDIDKENKEDEEDENLEDEYDDEEEDDDDEEFHWDDDDDDELNFEGENYILSDAKKDNEEDEDDEEDEEDEDEENLEENNDEEDEIDKEIDEILGFFDNEEEYTSELENYNNEDDSEDDEDIGNEIFDQEDEEKIEQQSTEEDKEKNKGKNKKGGLFARRKK